MTYCIVGGEGGLPHISIVKNLSEVRNYTPLKGVWPPPPPGFLPQRLSPALPQNRFTYLTYQSQQQLIFLKRHPTSSATPSPSFFLLNCCTD